MVLSVTLTPLSERPSSPWSWASDCDKLPSETSVFSAEVWAIYQSILISLDAGRSPTLIISDSKSALATITSIIQIILTISSLSSKQKFHCPFPDKSEYASCEFPPTETYVVMKKLISLLKHLHGHKPNFKAPHTDLYALSLEKPNRKFNPIEI